MKLKEKITIDDIGGQTFRSNLFIDSSQKGFRLQNLMEKAA